MLYYEQNYNVGALKHQSQDKRSKINVSHTAEWAKRWEGSGGSQGKENMIKTYWMKNFLLQNETKYKCSKLIS